jgi:hypothetical protein
MHPGLLLRQVLTSSFNASYQAIADELYNPAADAAL